MTPRPITPDHFDMNLIRTDDDDNQTMAKLFARNAIAQGFAVEYAGKTYRPPAAKDANTGDLADLGMVDGTVEVMPPSVERVVDLGADDEPRLIHITTRDGHRHTLAILSTVRSARLQAWYSAQIADLMQKMAATHDEEEMLELGRRREEYQEKHLRLTVPNLPADLVGQLSLTKYGQLMDTINLMVAADQVETTSPNGNAARS